MSEVHSSVEYRPVFGFPGYRVGSDGSVWSENYWPKGEWRRLRGGLCSKGGYLKVTLALDKKPICKLVHVLVLEAFVGPRPDGMDSCHNDGNPSNNTVENLRWDTRKGNFADKKKHGTQCKGETHGRSKLTEEDVRSIRREFKELNTPIRRIAERYGIHETTMSDAIRGITWSHVV